MSDLVVMRSFDSGTMNRLVTIHRLRQAPANQSNPYSVDYPVWDPTTSVVKIELISR